MSADVSECPARAAFETLIAEPALTARTYRELIHALHPIWVEEVMCPVHVAVNHLHQAAQAAAYGNEPDVKASHEAARTYLYEALSKARLLTLEEGLQAIVVDDLLRDAQSDERPGSSTGPIVHGWNAWRRTDAT